MIITSHPAYIQIKKRAEWLNPDKAVDMGAIEGVDPLLLDAFLSKRWVKVTNTVYDHTRCGWVAATGGYWPTLMLMPRRNSTGSSDLLGRDDLVVGVKIGNGYNPIVSR